MNCLEWLIELLKSKPQPIPPDGKVDILELEQQLLDAHNNQRQKHGLQPLKSNNHLNIAAKNHTIWMAANHKLSHSGNGNSTAGERIKQAGYKWFSYGENIAMGYANVEAVMAGWMNSIGHKNNILGNFTEVGFGVTNNAGKIYWTADFAKPRTLSSNGLIGFLSEPEPIIS